MSEKVTLFEPGVNIVAYSYQFHSTDTYKELLDYLTENATVSSYTIKDNISTISEIKPKSESYKTMEKSIMVIDARLAPICRNNDVQDEAGSVIRLEMINSIKSAIDSIEKHGETCVLILDYVDAGDSFSVKAPFSVMFRARSIVSYFREQYKVVKSRKIPVGATVGFKEMI